MRRPLQQIGDRNLVHVVLHAKRNGGVPLGEAGVAVIDLVAQPGMKDCRTVASAPIDSVGLSWMPLPFDVPENCPKTLTAPSRFFKVWAVAGRHADEMERRIKRRKERDLRRWNPHQFAHAPAHERDGKG